MDKLNNDNSDCLQREITKDSDNDDDDRANIRDSRESHVNIRDSRELTK